MERKNTVPTDREIALAMCATLAAAYVKQLGPQYAARQDALVWYATNAGIKAYDDHLRMEGATVVEARCEAQDALVRNIDYNQ